MPEWLTGGSFGPEATVFGVASEIICPIEIEDSLHLKEAMKNAYYVASLKSQIKTDIPLANYYNEQFDVSIWEENQVFDTTVFFTEKGLSIQSHVIYQYDAISADVYQN